jgi:hypothetical protein
MATHEEKKRKGVGGVGVIDRETCKVSSVVGIPSFQLGMKQHIWM